MRRVLLLLDLLLVLSTAVHAADALKNGSFAQPGDQPGLAADWIWTANSGWARSANGGPEGRPCLVFSSEKPAGGLVRQQADFLKPGATYVLRVVSRCKGPLQPAVALRDRQANQDLIPPVLLAQEDDWQARRVEFKATTADVDVVIAPDASLFKGGQGAPGQVLIASIEILPVGEQKPAQIVPKLGENLALTRPYTLSPRPSYALCSDPDDKTQLTDGVYTEGHFWTRPTTVGWQGTDPKFINIDLGHDYPIRGISYSTAAGVAEVHWPVHLYIFVSPDGQKWHKAGDLVPLAAAHDPLPMYGEYANYHFWTDKLQTHGRYVQIVALSDSFNFVDEIEVYRGDDSFMAAAYADAGKDNLQQYMTQCLTDNLIQQQLRKDLRAVQSDVAALPAGQKAAFETRLAALGQAIDTMPTVPMEGFRAVLPMLPLEKDIFALQAEVWRAQGKPALRVWANQRWDPLEPSQEPPEGGAAPALKVDMMGNEYRAGVVNLTNASDRPLQLALRLTGLPGGTNPGYVKVYQVEHVGTRWFDSVAAALPEVKATASGYPIEVPVGMTRQVWFTFNPRTLKGGTYNGSIEISGGATVQKVPVKLAVWPIRFPDHTTLSLGGWDYTNNEKSYGITARNRDAVLAYLKAHYVNLPWGSGALPMGAFDAAGNMAAPDTTNFDNWLKTWPNANLYAVFVPSQDNLGGVKMGTPLFNTMVGYWAHFWAQHARDKGLKPSQLALLIYDEPSKKSQYDIIVAWGKAIKAAEPELRLWEDPQPTEPNDVVEMLATVDIIAPYRSQYLMNPGGWLQKLYENARQQGKDLSFYNADGPARTFDPYSFYLLQEWHVFVNGGSSSCFWAFSDNGGVDCWNEYPAKGNGPYCPYYLSDDSITGAKYMEAIREGVEDYEYLTMLKRRVAELEKKGVAPAKLAAAKALLSEGPQRVLAEDTGRAYRWDVPKHREIQDQVRVEILKALCDLQKL